MHSFKKASVKPMHKSGDTSLVHDFRPISISPYVRKVFDRVLSNKFCSYLSKNKSLHDDEYGFRENRSTTDALFYSILRNYLIVLILTVHILSCIFMVYEVCLMVY